MAFKHTDTELTDNQVMTLPARQCSFAFEQTTAHIVLVLMPTGTFHAFEYENDKWTEVAKVEVIPGMTDCNEAMMVAGYGQAFILHKETQALYALNLEHVEDEDGMVEVTKSELGFTPFSAVVAGVPKEVACDSKEDGHDGHSHGNKGTSSAKAMTHLVVSTLLSFVAASFSG